MAWVAHALIGLHSTLWEPRWFGAIWTLVAAPLIEETALRFLLQKGIQERFKVVVMAAGRPASLLRGREGHAANALVAFVFVLMHAPAQGWLSVWLVVPALAIGEVWRRAERLVDCVLLHSWFNLCLMSVTYLAIN